MANVKDYQNSLITGINTLVSNAVDNLKLDKTITATVTNCVSADMGQYMCSYNGGTITAYAYTGAAYAVDDCVYILVPQNDMTKKKYITGIAATATVGDISNNSLKNYVTLNNNTMTLEESPFTLDCSKEDYAYLYVHDENSDATILENGNTVTYAASGHYTKNYITLKENELRTNLLDQTISQVGLVAAFQTQKLQTQNVQGRYGIILNIVCTDNTQLDDNNEFVTKTIAYQLNSNDMSGNPYAYNVPSTQYTLFDSLKSNYTFQYIRDIVLYQDGFNDGTISLNSLQFLCLNENIVYTEDDEYSLSLQSGGINAFETYSDNETITLTATLKNKDADRSKEFKANYYWGLKDATITSESSDYYNEKLGEGWRCVDYGSGDREKYKYICKASQNTAKSNVYKCIAEYKASESNTISLSMEITLFNLASTIGVSIKSSSGNIFNFKGTTVLTCLLNNRERNFVDNESDAVFTFSWSRTIKDSPQATKASTETLAQKQSGNTLYVKDLKDIDGKYVVYTCTVLRNNYNVGSAQIAMQDSETWITSGSRIEIFNGNQLFQYDESGQSPTLAATPQAIKTLSARFYDKQGNITYDSGSSETSGFSIQWRIPSQYTMLIAPVGSVQDSDTDYVIYENKTCDFTIYDIYDAAKTNNQIQVTLSDLATGETYTKETNLIFTKVGENGTNGTTNASTIIVREDYNLENNSHLALIVDKKQYWNAAKEYTYDVNGNYTGQVYATEEDPILHARVFSGGELAPGYSVSWHPAGQTTMSKSQHYTYDSSADDNTYGYGIVKYSKVDNVFSDDTKAIAKLDNRIACAEIDYKGSVIYDYYPIPTIEYEDGYTYSEYPITIPDNKYLKNVYYSSNGSTGATPTYSKSQGAFYKLESKNEGETIAAHSVWEAKGGKDDESPALRLSTTQGATLGNKQVSTLLTATAEDAVRLAQQIKSRVNNYTGDDRIKRYLNSLMTRANNILSTVGIDWPHKLANLKSEYSTWLDTNSPNENIRFYADNEAVINLANDYSKLCASYIAQARQNATAEQTIKIMTEVNKFLNSTWPNLTWQTTTGVTGDEKTAELEAIRTDALKVHDFESKCTESGTYLTHTEFFNKFKALMALSTAKRKKTLWYRYTEDVNFYEIPAKKYTAKTLNSFMSAWISAIRNKIMQIVRNNKTVTITYSDGSTEEYTIGNLTEIENIYKQYFYAWADEVAAVNKVTINKKETKVYYYQNQKTGKDLSADALNKKYSNKFAVIKKQLTTNAMNAINDTVDHSNLSLDAFVAEMQNGKETYTDGIYIVPPSQCDAILCNDNVVCNVYATIAKNGRNIVTNKKIATITYPVHLGLNTYELKSLNGWDGHSIQINEEDNYIVAPQIAAGVKDTATNHFTGIVAGAVSNPNEDGTYESSEKVGIIGYANGEQSIFLDAKTGEVTLGLISDNTSEGRIELVPGGTSKIGNWQIGNTFLANIVDGTYELRTDSDLREAYYETNDAGSKVNTLDKVRIPVDKAGIVLSSDLPYIHVKSAPYTITELGSSSIAETDTVNALGVDDSLEVKIDPNNKGVFSIVQHTANHQVQLQDTLHWGELEGIFVKPFTQGVDDAYSDSEVLYTYQYDLDDEGNVQPYTNVEQIVEFDGNSNINNRLLNTIYGSSFLHMHYDNAVENLADEDNDGVNLNADGSYLKGFDSKSGSLTIYLNDEMKSQAVADYTGTFDSPYTDVSFYADFDEDTTFEAGSIAGVEITNYTAPVTFTWEIVDTSGKVLEKFETNKNGFIIGTDEKYIGCSLDVTVRDATGASKYLSSSNTWDEYIYERTIDEDTTLEDVACEVTGVDFTYAEEGATSKYRKCVYATQTIELCEAVDENHESWNTTKTKTYDLTKSDFIEEALPFPEVASDDTSNYAIRWKSTVQYINNVFMPDLKIGTLHLTNGAADLVVKMNLALSNGNYSQFSDDGVSLVLQLFDGTQMVYTSDEVTDSWNTSTPTVVEFTFSDEDTIEPGEYTMYLHLQDECLQEEVWEESVTYEICRRIGTPMAKLLESDNDSSDSSSSNSEAYYTMRIIVEDKDDLYIPSNNDASTVAGNSYGILNVNSVTAECLLGGATKTGLYYENELNIYDTDRVTKRGTALSLTTPSLIKIYRRYYDLVQDGVYSNYAVCLIKEEEEDVYTRCVKSLNTTAINELFEADSTKDYIELLPENISEYYNWEEIPRVGLDETGQLYSDGVQGLRTSFKFGIVPAFGNYNNYGITLDANNEKDGYGHDQILKVLSNSYETGTSARDTIIAAGDTLNRRVRIFSSGATGRSSLWYSSTENNQDTINSYVTTDKNGVTIKSDKNIRFKINGQTISINDIMSGIEAAQEKKAAAANASAAVTVQGTQIFKKIKTVKIPSGYGTSYTYERIDRSDWSNGSAQKAIYTAWSKQKKADKFDKLGFAKYKGRYLIATTNYVAGGTNAKSPKQGLVYLNVNIKNYKGKSITLPCILMDEKNLSDEDCNKWGHNYGKSTIEFLVNGRMNIAPKWYVWGKTEKGTYAWVGGHTNPGNKGCMKQWKGKVTSVVRVKLDKEAMKNSTAVIGEKIASTAEKELKLWKAGKCGNHKASGNKYQKYLNYSGDVAWCCAFVSYVLEKAGLKRSMRFHTGACITAMNWGKRKGYWISNSSGSKHYMKKMQRGDIILYHPDCHHIAICVKGGQYYSQIGGNQGSGGSSQARNVCKQTYPASRSDTTILGVIRIGKQYKIDSSGTIKTASLIDDDYGISTLSVDNDDFLVADESNDMSEAEFITLSLDDNSTMTEANDTVESDDDDGYDPDGNDVPEEEYDEADDEVDDVEYVQDEDFTLELPERLINCSNLNVVTQEAETTSGITLKTSLSGSFELKEGIAKIKDVPLHTNGGLIVRNNFKIYSKASFYNQVSIEQNGTSLQVPELSVGLNYSDDTTGYKPLIRVGNESKLNGLMVSYGNIHAKQNLYVGLLSDKSNGFIKIYNTNKKGALILKTNADGYGSIVFKGQNSESSYILDYDAMKSLEKLITSASDLKKLAAEVDSLLELAKNLKNIKANVKW